jgi:hypothetical protein
MAVHATLNCCDRASIQCSVRPILHSLWGLLLARERDPAFSSHNSSSVAACPIWDVIMTLDNVSSGASPISMLEQNSILQDLMNILIISSLDYTSQTISSSKIVSVIFEVFLLALPHKTP